MAAQTPEGRVKAKIKTWLQARGIWFFMPVSSGFGVKGVPDFVCCIGGTFLGIEAKAPGKLSNTSELQKIQLAAIKAAGGIAIVVDDVSQLDQLEKELK